MDFHHIEICFLCDGKGALETEQVNDIGYHEVTECPCCHGAGELRVHGGERSNN